VLSIFRVLIVLALIALPRLALSQDITVGGDVPCHCEADHQHGGLFLLTDDLLPGTTIVGGGVLVHMPPVHRSTGDADLDRAITWCDANEADEYYNGSMGGSPLWGYKDERCRRVEKAWENSSSEKARREAEEAAKKAADEAWLDSYVKGLPK
jgi:hypothetical protein